MRTVQVQVGDTTIATNATGLNCATTEEVESFIYEVMSNSSNRKVIVGVNIDWLVKNNSWYHEWILTMCVGQRCLMVAVTVGINTTEYDLHSRLPPPLHNFINDPDVYFVGVDIHSGLKKFRLECRNAIELRELSASLFERPLFGVLNVVDLASEVAGLTVVKPHREWKLGLWDAYVQVQSASIDAYAAFVLGEKLLSTGLKKVKVEANKG